MREIIRNMAAGAYELALATEGQGPATGPVVHQEPCHWVTGTSGDVHKQDPLPVAFGPEGDTYRRWAIDQLAEQGRQFRVAYTSVSMAAIRGAVASGLAVSVMARSSMTMGMRVLTREDGFPDLPVLRICLITSPRSRTEMVRALESFLVSRMRERAGDIADRPTPSHRRGGQRKRARS